MNNNVYVRVRGGLGNQMFQYAYALALANYNKRRIILDIREYKDYYWPFNLNSFVLADSVLINAEDKLPYDFKIKLFHIYQFIKRKISKKELLPPKCLLKKGYIFTDIFSPDPSLINEEGNIFLYGYFQDVKYLLPIQKELYESFTLIEKSHTLIQYLSLVDNNALAISMRFAEDIELAKGEKYIYSDSKYYIDAIEYIFQHKEEKQLVVMSNSIEKAKKLLKEKFSSSEIVFIENLSAQEQIEVFKKCNDFIISNSTFAWWGAFLGSYGKDSIIISPRTWYQGTDIDSTHLFFEKMKVF